MDNIKNDSYYIDRITTDLSFIVDHTKLIDYVELCKNEILLDSVMFRLIQISENSDKLTEGFKLRNNHIPWRAMKGLRNRLVHEYGNVDLSIVYDTVKNDIPDLLKSIQDINIQ